AIRAAERLVALDPLREHAQRLLIRLLARYRGRDAALTRADGLVETLRAELDAAPEPDTMALIEEIRRNSAAPAAPVGVRRAAVGVPDTIVASALTANADRPSIAPHDAASLQPPPQRNRLLRFPAVAWSTVGVCALGIALFALFTRDRPIQPGDAHAVPSQAS